MFSAWSENSYFATRGENKMKWNRLSGIRDGIWIKKYLQSTEMGGGQIRENHLSGIRDTGIWKKIPSILLDNQEMRSKSLWVRYYVQVNIFNIISWPDEVCRSTRNIVLYLKKTIWFGKHLYIHGSIFRY